MSREVTCWCQEPQLEVVGAGSSACGSLGDSEGQDHLSKEARRHRAQRARKHEAKAKHSVESASPGMDTAIEFSAQVDSLQAGKDICVIKFSELLSKSAMSLHEEQKAEVKKAYDRSHWARAS